MDSLHLIAKQVQLFVLQRRTVLLLADLQNLRLWTQMAVRHFWKRPWSSLKIMVIIFAYWIQYTIMKKNWIMVSTSTNALLSHTHTHKKNFICRGQGRRDPTPVWWRWRSQTPSSGLWKGWFLFTKPLILLSRITMFGVWQCIVKLIKWSVSFHYVFIKIVYVGRNNVQELYFCLLWLL